MPATEGLTAPPPAQIDWRGPALQQRLAGLLPGLVVEVVGAIGSTNTELVERIRRHAQGEAGSPQTTPALQAVLLVAEQQTQGRGRQGKTWHSAAGSSVTMSLALPLAPADWSGLSLAVGLALAEALEPADSSGQAPCQMQIKWPNDLLLATPADAPGPGRKLGGILIETVPVGRRRMAVIGVGLNLLPQAVNGALSWGQACVQELVPGLEAPSLLARMAPALLQGVLDFERSGFAPLVARFARRDALRGRWVTTALPQMPQGQADGVDAQGMLWLRDGERRLPVGSGEVSLRPTAPPHTRTPAA